MGPFAVLLGKCGFLNQRTNLKVLSEPGETLMTNKHQTPQIRLVLGIHATVHMCGTGWRIKKESSNSDLQSVSENGYRIDGPNREVFT